MILMLIVAIPILIVNTTSVNIEKDGNIFLMISTIIALFGLIFETIADMQLKEFLKIKKPGQIFNSGLYRYSRHPNYFGESMFWLGVSLMALPYSSLAIL
jgi:steroid 5-alpha reductase family enzyme